MLTQRRRETIFFNTSGEDAREALKLTRSRKCLRSRSTRHAMTILLRQNKCAHCSETCLQRISEAYPRSVALRNSTKCLPMASRGTGADVACLSKTRFSLRSSTTGRRRARTTGAAQPGTLRTSPATARASIPLRCATIAEVTRSSSVRYVGGAADVTIVLVTGRRPARPYRASAIAGNTGRNGADAVGDAADAAAALPSVATPATGAAEAAAEAGSAGPLPAPPCAGAAEASAAEDASALAAAAVPVSEVAAAVEPAVAADAAAAASSRSETSLSLT